jgi:CDGSH-type Zn-finger protein
MKHQAGADARVWFCACKRTSTPPFCDGSHKKIAAPPTG